MSLVDSLVHSLRIEKSFQVHPGLTNNSLTIQRVKGTLIIKHKIFFHFDFKESRASPNYQIIYPVPDVGLYMNLKNSIFII